MTNTRRFAAVTAALSLAGIFGVAALPQTAAAQPQLTIQSEAAAHPRIVQGIRQMEATLHDLDAAPDDFGGNKAKAEADLRTAIHSLRKALFFRLHMDDDAIDRAQW
jgi:hypothetical protein